MDEKHVDFFSFLIKVEVMMMTRKFKRGFNMIFGQNSINKTHLKEDCLHRSAIGAPLLLHHGVQKSPGGDPLVGQPLGATQKPNKHIWQGMLGLH